MYHELKSLLRIEMIGLLVVGESRALSPNQSSFECDSDAVR